MKRDRPKTLDGYTFRQQTGCGYVYITINHDEDGKPLEIFITLGKAGGCIGTLLSIIGRMLSLALRSGVDIKEILEYVEDTPCPQSVPGTIGCPEAVARAIKLWRKKCQTF